MKKHLLDQKHPTEQEWMEYLYDEMNSAQRSALDTHLKECAPCREKREAWRGTQSALDQWDVVIPPKHELAATWQPAVKWAAAAVLLVSTAFATGRISRPSVDLEALQAQIARPIEQKVQEQAVAASQQVLAAEEKFRAELRALTDRALAEATAKAKRLEELEAMLATLKEDKGALIAALEEAQALHTAEYLRIRADLERVALFSQSVAQFASYSPPVEDDAQVEPETER